MLLRLMKEVEKNDQIQRQRAGSNPAIQVHGSRSDPLPFVCVIASTSFLS
jgi:hypothetical protein